MTFLIRHLLLAGIDPQRYSEIPPPEGCSLAKVPLDLLDTASEASTFGVLEANYDAQRACAEMFDFSLQNPNEDAFRSNSEVSDFRLNEPPRDEMRCASELSGFVLEAAS